MRPGDRHVHHHGILAGLGHPVDQLKGHINGALSVGITPREIVEALMQVAIYAGFPAATNALRVAKRVFADRGVSPLPDTGEN